MSTRDKLIIGTNTKMTKSIHETVMFLHKLEVNTADIDRAQMELFVIPSFTALERARASVPRASIAIGAQNMGWADEGPFTGEISPVMLREVGVDIVEIGHSERRHVLRETDEDENQKVVSALRHGFTALLCIGETARQKALGISDDVMRIQLKTGLHGVTPQQAEKLWIAYEPVWAIGEGGTPATADYAEQKHGMIREALVELFGPAPGGDIPILYGGSVNAENAPGLIEMPHVDGLFVGRSAWDADSFSSIIHNVLPLFLQKRAQEQPAPDERATATLLT